MRASISRSSWVQARQSEGFPGSRERPWLPANRAGQIVIELLFSDRFKPIYHMENPARHEWTAVIDNLSDILVIPVLDYGEWLE